MQSNSALKLVGSSEVVQVNSFTQDTAHGTKSAKFVTLTPSETAQIMADYGFEQVSLEMGRARIADRAAHQNVTARYRSRNALQIDGLWMDIISIQKHLYGADSFHIGTWRKVCGNGLTVGHKFVSGRVVHLGSAQSQLEALLPSLVAQHDQLVDHIRMMQARNVTPSEVAQLTQTVANLRLDGIKNIRSIQYADLMRIRRDEDRGTDLFTVLNVLQENVMRYGVRYQVESTQTDTRTGVVTNLIRNQTARPVTKTRQGDVETVRSVEMNASIWDAAMNILSQKEA